MFNKLPTNQSNENIIVKLPEDFSGLNVDKYRDHFEQLRDTQNGNLVLDFGATEFIDSSGIGAMVFLYKRVEKQGVSMQLLNVAGQPNKLLKLLRVDMTIPFIDKVA